MDSDPRVRLIAVIGFLFWLGVSVNGIQSVPLAIISWAVAGAIGIWLLWTWTPPRVAGNIWKVAASIVVLFALWFLTSLLNPQYLAERREIYQQFQSELERRSGFYGEGFMKILGIELLDRNDPNYRSTLNDGKKVKTRGFKKKHKEVPILPRFLQESRLGFRDHWRLIMR